MQYNIELKKFVNKRTSKIKGSEITENGSLDVAVQRAYDHIREFCRGKKLSTRQTFAVIRWLDKQVLKVYHTGKLVECAAYDKTIMRLAQEKYDLDDQIEELKQRRDAVKEQVEDLEHYTLPILKSRQRCSCCKKTHTEKYSVKLYGQAGLLMRGPPALTARTICEGIEKARRLLRRHKCADPKYATVFDGCHHVRIIHPCGALIGN